MRDIVRPGLVSRFSYIKSVLPRAAAGAAEGVAGGIDIGRDIKTKKGWQACKIFSMRLNFNPAPALDNC